ncbi:prepilin-type N-terminal cleavage/methylation domain-containing protein [Candidatus Sumerlaeota bacterium]|nr:prepilin-type N-terminal cleavage/methylation domain-containing protein [Candidatus Sumerlaeota bacterium]
MKHWFLNSGRWGFTLIELLIVVAIIAILASIAVPNFLEAQIRSKHSRVLGEFSSYATALESYAVDHNHYPSQGTAGGGGADRLNVLTTPIAYMTSAMTVDPFTNISDPENTDRYYKYRNYAELVEEKPMDYAEYVKTYQWGLISCGPDKIIIQSKKFFDNKGLIKKESFYDPTNGTVSEGDVFRTHSTGQSSGK